MQVPSLEGASKVVEAFGFFPTFHDGEIIDLHLNRNTTPEEDYPTVSIHFTLHGWELTSEITASGHHRLIKHHLIKFQFDHIDGVDLRYFNHQNVISGLSITKIEPPTDHALLQVEFGSCYVSKGDSVLFPDPLLKWSLRPRRNANPEACLTLNGTRQIAPPTMWTPTTIESRSTTLDLSASAQGRQTVRQVLCDDVTVCNATDYTDWSADPIQLELCEACLVEGCGSGGRVVIRKFADRILIIPDFNGLTQGAWEECEYAPPRWLINKGPLSFLASDWILFQKASIEAPAFESVPQASTAEVLRLYHFLAPRSFLPNHLSPAQANWALILCTNGDDSENDLRNLKRLFTDPSCFEGHEFCTPAPESYVISVFLDTPTMLEWPIFSSEVDPAIRLSDQLYVRLIPKNQQDRSTVGAGSL